MIITAIILGSLIGSILGLTGAGGGIFAVPALVIALGYDMKTATPVALLAVGVAALVGTLDGLHKKEVRYKAAFFMAAMGALCSNLGLTLAAQLPDPLLATGFACIMLVVGWRGFRNRNHGRDKPSAHTPPCRINPKTGRLSWTRGCATALAFIGAITGLFAGLFGVGGGFVVVPALKRYSDLDVHSIIATSLMLIALVSLSAAANGLWRAGTLEASSYTFVGAAVLGMVAGRSFASRLPEQRLQQGFAMVTWVVAVVLLVRAWLSPWGEL